MPKVMGALSSGNIKAILPDLLELLDDKTVEKIRGSLNEFMRRKSVDGYTFSVVFEPDEAITGIHMRIWQKHPDYGAALKLDVPLNEITAADLHAIVKPLFEQA